MGVTPLSAIFLQWAAEEVLAIQVRLKWAVQEAAVMGIIQLTRMRMEYRDKVIEAAMVPITPHTRVVGEAEEVPGRLAQPGQQMAAMEGMV